jgi:hypothetical protein
MKIRYSGGGRKKVDASGGHGLKMLIPVRVFRQRVSLIFSGFTGQ